MNKKYAPLVIGTIDIINEMWDPRSEKWNIDILNFRIIEVKEVL